MFKYTQGKGRFQKLFLELLTLDDRDQSSRYSDLAEYYLRMSQKYHRKKYTFDAIEQSELSHLLSELCNTYPTSWKHLDSLMDLALSQYPSFLASQYINRLFHEVRSQFLYIATTEEEKPAAAEIILDIVRVKLGLKRKPKGRIQDLFDLATAEKFLGSVGNRALTSFVKISKYDWQRFLKPAEMEVVLSEVEKKLLNLSV